MFAIAQIQFSIAVYALGVGIALCSFSLLIRSAVCRVKGSMEIQIEKNLLDGKNIAPAASSIAIVARRSGETRGLAVGRAVNVRAERVGGRRANA